MNLFVFNLYSFDFIEVLLHYHIEIKKNGKKYKNSTLFLFISYFKILNDC